jgi:hypothetical protein
MLQERPPPYKAVPLGGVRLRQLTPDTHPRPLEPGAFSDQSSGYLQRQTRRPGHLLYRFRSSHALACCFTCAPSLSSTGFPCASKRGTGGIREYFAFEGRCVVPARSSGHRISRLVGHTVPGRNSTYRPVQISGATSLMPRRDYCQNIGLVTTPFQGVHSTSSRRSQRKLPNFTGILLDRAIRGEPSNMGGV